MEEQQIELEKTKKAIDELRGKMDTIILALEKVKMFDLDPTQPNYTISESVEVSSSLPLPMKGFIPPSHTSYRPWYHVPAPQFPYQFFKGESVSMNNQAEFLHPKNEPTGGKGKILNSGTNIFGNIDASKLCLVPDVMIPSKFRVPEFEKYDGTSCPKSHLIMYRRKMTGYIQNERLLIHCFQYCLTGSASRWYMQLDSAHIYSWKKLAESFLKQYQHNLYMAPDCMNLERMEKNSTESFKEYAQRWIDVAAQVQPPLTDKESLVMFMNTLKFPFYEKMIGCTSSNFSDIITIGERIEYGIKHGKITDTSELSIVKEVEEKVQMMGNENHVNLRQQPYSKDEIPQYLSNYRSDSYAYPQTPLHTQSQQNHREAHKQLTPVPLNLMQLPYPKLYDVNARCDYHAGAVGHSTDNWLNFKNGNESQSSLSSMNQNLKKTEINLKRTEVPHM